MSPRYAWLAVVLSLLGGSAGAASEADDATELTPSAGTVTLQPSAPKPAPPNRLGAVLDNALYLAAGGTWYLLDDVNKPDRIYPWRLSTLEKKFVTREAFRFDENAFSFVSPGHATSGMLYYLAGRSHGWGVLESFALSAATSTTWELVFEYQEVLSINDLVMTPTSGLAFGESVYQLGEYFRRSSPSPVHWFFATALSGPSPLLPWYRSRGDSHVATRDLHGHPLDMWGRVHVTAGGDVTRGTSGASRSAALLGLDARLFQLGDYAKAGTTDPQWVGRTVGAEVHARVSASPTGIEDSWLATGALLAAARGRDLAEAPGGLSGVEWLVGPSSQFEHRQSRNERGGSQLASFGPVGAAGHFSLHSGALQLRADGSLHPAFAATDSTAWRTTSGCPNPDAIGAPRTLAKHCFYFALGARLAASADVEWYGWRARAWMSNYWLSSAEWLQVPSQASRMVLDDEHLFAGATVGHQLPLQGVSVQAGIEHFGRWSRADGTIATSRDSRLLLQLAYEL